jgi:WD repeat-containing protein 48
MLRIKKLLSYVVEKLEATNIPGRKPEQWLEMVCGSVVLDSQSTLAYAKHQIWKSGGDLQLHYRPIVRFVGSPVSK